MEELTETQAKSKMMVVILLLNNGISINVYILSANFFLKES